MRIPLDQTRDLLREHGRVSPQDAAEWDGPFPLPEALVEFYREVGPVDVSVEGYGNPTCFPRLSSLWSRQSGYRWNGLTGEPIPDWEDSWLVVADEGADPYIFAIPGGCIQTAMYGAGSWDADEAYPDISTMAARVATLGSVVVHAGRGLTDAESCVKPEHREMAVAKLTALTGDALLAGAIVDSAGWG